METQQDRPLWLKRNEARGRVEHRLEGQRLDRVGSRRTWWEIGVCSE